MTYPPFMINRSTTAPVVDAAGLAALESNALDTLRSLSLTSYSSFTSVDFGTLMTSNNEVPALEDVVEVVTPPSSPTPNSKDSTQELPPKKTNKVPKKAASMGQQKKKVSSRSSCLLPTANDPMDPSFLMMLYSDADKGRINPTHVIIRREVLEVRRTVSGRIFFQCACCKHLPRSERARRSTLAPQSTENLYRTIIHFMMHHVPDCKHIPLYIKTVRPKDSKKPNMRGIRAYWIESAKLMGFTDGDDKRSIVYRPKDTTKSQL